MRYRATICRARSRDGGQSGWPLSWRKRATTNRDAAPDVSHPRTGMRSYSQEEGGDFSYEAGYTATKRLSPHATWPESSCSRSHRKVF